MSTCCFFHTKTKKPDFGCDPLAVTCASKFNVLGHNILHVLCKHDLEIRCTRTGGRCMLASNTKTRMSPFRWSPYKQSLSLNIKHYFITITISRYNGSLTNLGRMRYKSLVRSLGVGECQFKTRPVDPSSCADNFAVIMRMQHQRVMWLTVGRSF